MGNRSSKTSSFFCCPCKFNKSNRSISSLSIDQKVIPTFDRLASNEKKSEFNRYPQLETIPLNLTEEELEKATCSVQNRRSVSLHNVILPIPETDKPLQSKPPLPPGKAKVSSTTRRSFRTNLSNTKRTYYSQSIEHARLSIEDLEKSLHGASSIDQWIDSLPMLGTPSLNRNKTVIPLRAVCSAQRIKRSLTVGDDSDQKSLNRTYQQELNESADVQPSTVHPDLSKLFTREILPLVKEIHLNVYVNDFLKRLKQSKLKATFNGHFLSTSVIHPLSGVDLVLVNDLQIYFHTPAEYFLPFLSSNEFSNYKLHEQIRSKCYFYPLTYGKIEINDEEYQRQSKELDRTHVVITLETKSKTETNENVIRSKKSLIDSDSYALLISNDSFHSGLIRIDAEKVDKHWLPFVFHSTEENCSYLSSNLIQQWFQTLILVNQTCSIAKRFLKGDGSHITCLLKQHTNQINSFVTENNLTFAALRLPPFLLATGLTIDNVQQQENSDLIDGFSSTFLSDNQKTTNDTIHIDYEQYSFAFSLHRWPKSLLDQYHLCSNRRSERRWPSNYHMNILIKKPLLLTPTGHDHRWEIQFDSVEQNLFELMPETTLYAYGLSQQILAQTNSTRTIVKNCFLNFAEQHGLPFANLREAHKETFLDFIFNFLKDIYGQLKEEFVPHYFNHQLNLYKTIENPNQWFEHVEHCLEKRVDINSVPALIVSNRPIIVEFLFHFLDQLYQTFHLKRSQFHLNENVLLDLHQQVCEKFSNDPNNNNSASLQKLINTLLNNSNLLEQIQSSLTEEFESNAELVHTCLNQVRKADSSLIFHYTWTIYVQYLHTYYNALWNI